MSEATEATTVRKKRHYDNDLHAHPTGDAGKKFILPHGMDRNVWLAKNTIDFYNDIAQLYGLIKEFCTDKSCPVMNAGPKFEYLWQDETKYKEPTKLSAPEYFEQLCSWVEGKLNDEQIFPTKKGSKYPSDFEDTVAAIFKRLFRVYAHIYHGHGSHIRDLGRDHLSTFRDFVFFTTEFNLIRRKEELEPLAEQMQLLLGKKPLNNNKEEGKDDNNNNKDNQRSSGTVHILDIQSLKNQLDNHQ